MDQTIIEKALELYPIGGTYIINQTTAYNGSGGLYKISPKHISNYSYQNGNLAICQVGVYNKRYGIFATKEVDKNPHYEIY
jgi:hypothetical protein